MKLAAPYRCDYCANTKGEANHWWMRAIHEPFFALLRWNEETAGNRDRGGNSGIVLYEHICSEQCAVKALSKWMATTPQRPTEAA